MTTVILNATLCDGANEFISCLEELCAQRGIQVSVQQPCTDTCIILANKMPTMAEPLAEPVPPEQEMGPAEPVAAVTVAAADVETMQSTAVPAPVNEFCGEAVVLSLTTQCAVPVKCDPSIPCSKICVSAVELVGDSVFFEYCGATYKFPAICTGSPCDAINNSVVDDNMMEKCIRVVMQFTSETFPAAIVVQVCEKTAEEPYHIILGSDLTQLYPA